MTRNNENPAQDAGARFVKQLRDLGFKCKVLIFTSDAAKGLQYVKGHCGANIQNILVTQSVLDAQKFIAFDG